MTSKEFKLPDVGEGIAEATIVRWLVEPGDDVAEDQPVAEVETDKAIVEVPSPFTGVVDELLAEEGETVPVGTAIISVRTEGGTDAGPTAGDSAGVEAAAASTATDESRGSDPTAVTECASDDEYPPRRVVAPPSVRRFAREHGVDLTEAATVRSTHRLTKADIRAVVARRDESTAEQADQTAVSGDGSDRAVEPAAMSDTDTGTDVDVDHLPDSPSETLRMPNETPSRTLTLARPSTRRIAREEGVDLNAVPTDERRDGNAYVTESQVRQFARSGPESAADPADVPSAEAVGSPGPTAEVRPYKGIRKTIGDRMAQSKFTAPHVTHHDTATIPELIETRELLSSAADEHEASITYLPFILKAVVAALRRTPILNSTLAVDDEEIRIQTAYHIGIAVATDFGLVVPVIEDVDTKGIATLAAEISDLAERARSRDLSPDELSGSTFTITNFGAIGGEYGTPIINYPETAILGLGAIDDRAVAEDGEVVAQPTLPLSLSFDHRVIDGAIAAEFTNTVMEYLEQPQLLLMR